MNKRKINKLEDDILNEYESNIIQYPNSFSFTPFTVKIFYQGNYKYILN
tara:strand:- start:38298 stop:38444 length:147 start_codon:yes stop_codon:yes gene_type:complete